MSRHPLLILTLTAWLGAPAVGLAQAVLRADTIADAAGTTWDTRWAASYDVRAQGQRDAATRVPSRWSQLNVGLEPATVVAAPDQGYADQVLSAEASLTLGDGLVRQRAQWDALASATLADGQADRARFVLAAEDAFIQWAAEAMVVAHLQEDLATYRASLEALEPGVQALAISRMDWLDLQADASRLAMEVLDAEQRATDLAADLARMVDGTPDLAGASLSDAGLTDNPWIALRGHSGEHPDVLALEANAEALRAQASATENNPLTLSVGPALHYEASGLTWFAGTVGLSIPLSNPGHASATALLADAVALDAERDATQATLRSVIGAEAERYETLLYHLNALTDEHLTLLEEREAMVTEGLALGHATVEQVIRARREHHEAEHHRILVLADLYRSSALARQYATLLATDIP